MQSSLKVEKSMQNSYFQFSTSEVHTITMNVEADSLEYTIEESSCAFPFIFASRSLVTFTRSALASRGFEIAGLGESTLLAMLDLAATITTKQTYTIPLKSEGKIMSKYIYVACPFFKSEPSKTVLKLTTTGVQIPDTNDGVNLQTINTATFDFKKVYSGADFLNAILMDPSIETKFLQPLITKEGSSTTIDFGLKRGYLFTIQKTLLRFSIVSTDEVDYLVYMSTGNTDLLLKDQKSATKLELKVDRAEIESVEDTQDCFVLLMKSGVATTKVEIKEIPESSKILEALKKNWKYFFFFLLFLLVPVFWKVIQRIKEKQNILKKKKDEQKNLERKESIEKQKKARRITIFLHQNKNIDRKICE